MCITYIFIITRSSNTLTVLVVPEQPKITYSPGDTVYDGDLVTLTCVSETKDPKGTDVIWLVKGEVLEGDKLVGSDSVSTSITLPAALTDNNVRYECHVIHLNLPEPLIVYGRITGRFNAVLCLITLEVVFTFDIKLTRGNNSVNF